MSYMSLLMLYIIVVALNHVCETRKIYFMCVLLCLVVVVIDILV